MKRLSKFQDDQIQLILDLTHQVRESFLVLLREHLGDDAEISDRTDLTKVEILRSVAVEEAASRFFEFLVALKDLCEDLHGRMEETWEDYSDKFKQSDDGEDYENWASMFLALTKAIRADVYAMRLEISGIPGENPSAPMDPSRPIRPSPLLLWDLSEIEKFPRRPSADIPLNFPDSSEDSP